MTDQITKYRRGRIEVSTLLIEDNPTDIAKTFGLLEFLPKHIDRDTYMDRQVYYGISSKFEAIQEGVPSPLYIVTVSTEYVEGKREIKSVDVSMVK